MSRSTRTVAAVIVVGVVVLLGCGGIWLASLEPTAFVGHYTCSGTNVAGQPYVIGLEVTAYGDTYELLWTNNLGNPILRGVGLLMNEHLAVALVSPRGVGVALYAVSPGRISGLWSGGGVVMEEECKRGAAA